MQNFILGSIADNHLNYLTGFHMYGDVGFPTIMVLKQSLHL